MALRCFHLANPNSSSLRKTACRKPSIPCFSPEAPPISLRLDSSRRNRLQMLSATAFSYNPRGFRGPALLPARNRRPFLQRATPREDSAPLDDEFEEGKQGEEPDDARRRGFYEGVRYGGLIISIHGVVSSTITRSISPLELCVFPGAILLAYSVKSIRSWRRGKQVDGVIRKFQAALLGLSVPVQLYLFIQKPSFLGLISTAFSGVLAALYIFWMMNTKEGTFVMDMLFSI